MSFTANLATIVKENVSGLLSVHETWERVSLIWVATITNGYPFDSKLFTNNSGVPLLRIRDIFSNKTEVLYAGEIPDGYWVLRDDIVIGMDGDFNCSRWKGEPALLNQRVCKLTVNTDYMDSRFLFYAISGYLKAINDNTSSLTVKHLSSKTVANIPLPLPPFNEQKRVADKLDSLLEQVDECRHHLDRVLQILERFQQSVLAAATSGQLTEKWREEHGLELSDWNETAVSEIAEVFLGRQRSPKYHYGKHMRKYVRAANITWNGWDLSDIKEMNFDPEDFERYHLRIGDVLLNEGSGSIGEVGKPAVWNGEIKDCCFQNTLICVRPYETSSKYLYFVFLYAAISGAFTKEARGLGIFHIGRERLAGFRISIPTLDEQYEIVRRVENLFDLADSIIASWNVAQERVNQLVPSVLAKAFRGELVKQNLEDEPASQLLERIKLARENMPKETKKPRRKTETKTVKSKGDDSRLGVIQALKTAGKELSAQQLFQLAGYPLDAESDLVEDFFVEIRNALGNSEIQRRRQNETDWFLLIKQER